MLDIFFTNKIPSSDPTWTDELILVASIFERFDGMQYDRDLLTQDFETISNRLTGTRDAADYRDEYGAYASFLGLLHYEARRNHWLLNLNPLAKALLCSSYPNAQAFMRLQMALLQYPNPIGAVYGPSGGIRMEALSGRKRSQQVRQDIRTVPFRLILRVLLALYDTHGQQAAYLAYSEIWHCLFTQREAVGTPDPDGEAIARRVLIFRARPKTDVPAAPVRNLHVLQHTGLVVKRTHPQRLCLALGAGDRETPLGSITRTIAQMTSFFHAPQMNASEDTINQWAESALVSGEWARYYSGALTPSGTIETIVAPNDQVADDLLHDATAGPGAPLVDLNAERVERTVRMQGRTANAEESQVLRERANLMHRTILDILADRLRTSNIVPLSNLFIDIACTYPKRMIFEIKSCNDANFLDQVRKGISQLYEYRYRHESMYDAKLVLALESQPSSGLAWLTDYLVGDRDIALIWLEGEANLACPSYCRDCLENLVNRIHHMPA